MGGTGVCVAAGREALSDGLVDLIVHSFKDLPTPPASGLRLGAVPLRENPSDALCSRGAALAELPMSATVGTGSPRRAGQLLRLRPDLQVVPVRGNVETRLGRVEDDLDAVVLATAGLPRPPPPPATPPPPPAPRLLPPPPPAAPPPT